MNDAPDRIWRDRGHLLGQMSYATEINSGRRKSEQDEYIRTAIARKVKPLDWRLNKGAYPSFFAYSGVTKTTYTIDSGAMKSLGRWPLRINGFWTKKKYQQPEQAKAAAQADHERRILSALED